MDLPVKFPSEAEVILEDVARFRALATQAVPGDPEPPGRRPLRRISPKADWATQYAEEQEILAQRKIREFFARHGY